MAEKILNTRIQLKYDTLANWNDSSLILKKGEIAFAAVPTVEGSTLEPVMFKVGDGSKTFSQLDWASAKAADVYGWAKAAGLPVDATTAPEGQFVEGFAWENNKLVPKFRGFITEINETNKNKLDAPTTKAVKDYVDGVAANIVAQGTVVAEGAKIEVVQTGNTYTLSHEEVAAPTATDGIGRTYITEVTTDGYGHITGYKTATETDQNTGVMDVELETGSADKTLRLKVNGLEQADVEVKNIYSKSEVDTLIEGAKDYADKHDTNTAHTHDVGAGLTIEGAGGISGNVKYAANIDVKYDNSTIYLVDKTSNAVIGNGFDASAFVKDGFLQSVTKDVANNTITFTWNTDAGITETVIDIDDLVEIYTGAEGIDITDFVVKIADAGVTTVKIADKNVTEAKLSDEVTAKLNKQWQPIGDYQPAGNYKIVQTEVSDPTANGKSLTFIDTIAQNANGEITATKKNVNLDDYALKSELPTVNDGKFTVSGTGYLTGAGEMTANQAGNTSATLDLTAEAKGKIDNAIQTVTAGVGIKATKTGTTVNLEVVGKGEKDDDGNEVVWIFDCGGAE